MFELLAHRWLDHHYGAPSEAHQYQFYRCTECRALVNWKMIREGCCRACGNPKVRPAMLTKREKFWLLFWPWGMR